MPALLYVVQAGDHVLITDNATSQCGSHDHKNLLLKSAISTQPTQNLVHLIKDNTRAIWLESPTVY